MQPIQFGAIRIVVANPSKKRGALSKAFSPYSESKEVRKKFATFAQGLPQDQAALLVLQRNTRLLVDGEDYRQFATELFTRIRQYRQHSPKAMYSGRNAFAGPKTPLEESGYLYGLALQELTEEFRRKANPEPIVLDA